MTNKSNQLHYYLMLLPAMVFLGIFSFAPMFGIAIAFQKYVPAKGIFRSSWVGFNNILYMLQIPDSKKIFVNTVIIAVLKIITSLLVPLFFSLILNEARILWFKKTVQTIVYMPYFLSWVVLGSVVANIFALDGVINKLLTAVFGVEAIMFMGSNVWFRPILIITNVWKNFGYETVIYLAAIANINPVLYEAAVMDGASRPKQMIYITLPSILPTVALLTTLSLGNVLNAGFDQIFNLYNPLVYETADIIDTYVYRMGLIQMQYGLATAVGLMKSVISLLLIMASYKLAERFAGYRIF